LKYRKKELFPRIYEDSGLDKTPQTTAVVERRF